MARTRRRVLLSAAVAGFSLPAAGCLGGDNSTEGDDDSLIEAEPAELLLAREQLYDIFQEGWITEDAAFSLVAEADASVRLVPFDSDAGEFHESGHVVSGVWRYDDVDTARGEFADLSFHEGFGYEEHDIAVECIGGVANENADARALFRDANAIGAVRYENTRVDSELRERHGFDIAAAKHGTWRDD